MRAFGRVIPILCIVLSACSRHDADAEAPVQNPQATTQAPIKGKSFEVVTIQRPESLEHYHRPYRASYEACAYIRKRKSLPPPPPLAPPSPGYIIQRETYISDGVSTYYRSEDFNYKVDMEGETPSCKSGERKSWTTTVVRGGMMYMSGVDENGNAYTNPPEPAPPPEKGRDGSYTEPKLVKGFAVKCMKLPPDADQLLTEICAVDLKPGTLYRGRRPIVVAGRVTSVEKVHGAILTEPMVIKVGQPVDQHVFDVPGKP